ncbi:MAG: tRNA (guanosine(37)-N1)-methyltransferase TrmD [Bacilli bacterium]|jgi:tRNA (guanine37-N1)-methyltransferase|nr:tRNA (guanosine(37)-N1)-methyltransferase TrmD [Bacilli bacterium]
MITIKILTIFPDFYQEFIKSSIVGRAISRGLVKIELVNIRDYSLDKNHRVDDHPIGGGAGLIMRLEPLMDCLKANTSDKTYKILMGPKGHPYTQKDAKRLSKMSEICLICGHYEGIDSRFNDYVDEEISLGDFILTGGEIPAMAITDSIVRLLKGAIADESTEEESFNGSILEYPQYTYPDVYDGKKIPEILYCGNHQVIQEYRRKEALRVTLQARPDLFKTMTYTKKDVQYLQELASGEKPTEKEKEALVKGKKFIK